MAAKAVGAGVAGIAALYYGQVGWQVYGMSSEHKRIQRQLEAEVQSASQAEANARTTESRLPMLQGQVEDASAAVARLDSKIEAVQRELATLEQQRAGRLQEASQVQAALEEGHKELAKLLSEASRRRENAALAQQAIVIAERHAHESMKLLNPLHHPLVKSFLGK